MSKGKLGYFNPQKPQEGRITDMGHVITDKCFRLSSGGITGNGLLTEYWSPVS